MQTRTLSLFPTWTLALVLSLSQGVHADQTALNLGAGGGINFTNSNWTLGYEFTANANIRVKQLGFYDDFENGLTQSHVVGIWNLAGQLLTSATVTPADPLLDHFRYTAIQPFPLSAGTNYVVGALTGNENYSFHWSATTPAEITFVRDRYDRTATGTGILDFPESSDGLLAAGAGYLGPNLLYSDAGAAPEPGTLALLGIGAGLLLTRTGWRRRRAA